MYYVLVLSRFEFLLETIVIHFNSMFLSEQKLHFDLHLVGAKMSILFFILIF